MKPLKLYDMLIVCRYLFYKKSALKFNTVIHKELISTIICSLSIYRLDMLIENYMVYPRKLPCTHSISAEQSTCMIRKGEGRMMCEISRSLLASH
jgi:hypothetical protein